MAPRYYGTKGDAIRRRKTFCEATINQNSNRLGPLIVRTAWWMKYEPVDAVIQTDPLRFSEVWTKKDGDASVILSHR